MSGISHQGLATAVALAIVLCAASASAGDARETGWFDEAELSLIATRGNSEATSFGLANRLERRWPRATFSFLVSALRAESTDTTRTAVGPAGDDYYVVETEDDRVDADRYRVGLGFEQTLRGRAYWNTGLGWERDRPAGIENRLTYGAGLGHLWVDTEERTFRTEYGLTVTDEEHVDAPSLDDTYGGARLAARFRQKVGEHSEFVHETTFHDNLEDSSDYRAEMLNSIAVTMTERLALKVGLHWRYENEPSLEEVSREFPQGTPSGETVLVPLDELDSAFSASLVVRF